MMHQIFKAFSKNFCLYTALVLTLIRSIQKKSYNLLFFLCCALGMLSVVLTIACAVLNGGEEDA